MICLFQLLIILFSSKIGNLFLISPLQLTLVSSCSHSGTSIPVSNNPFPKYRPEYERIQELVSINNVAKKLLLYYIFVVMEGEQRFPNLIP